MPNIISILLLEFIITHNIAKLTSK